MSEQIVLDYPEVRVFADLLALNHVGVRISVKNPENIVEREALVTICLGGFHFAIKGGSISNALYVNVSVAEPVLERDISLGGVREGLAFIADIVRAYDCIASMMERDQFMLLWRFFEEGEDYSPEREPKSVFKSFIMSRMEP
ncbi:MAG: hypothetical protein ABIH88_00920 [Patescibacteria group bacterium]|nr:hypothetical protein [Patescibacteria group bacterium]